MLSIKEIITFAYDSAYDLSEKQLFTTPKIYTAKGDLNKRWYVYFSFRNPNTGKLKRLTPFYGEANKYKTKEERLEVLTVYRKTLLKLLKLGYNPFEDNTELFNKLNNKSKRSEKKNNTNSEIEQEKKKLSEQESLENKMMIEEAFQLGLKLKENTVSDRTLKDYENKVYLFLNWSKINHAEIKTVDQLNKAVFQNYLNYVLAKSSPRNRNNYRTDLSSVVQVLVDNEILKDNYLKKIKKLNAKPQRHKTYSSEIENEIFNYLEENDPILLLFIKFYAYAFMRPIEVCRIRVMDINIKDKTIVFRAKNSTLKTKILPQILLDDLPDLSSLESNSLLFSPNKIGAQWDANENSRRDHFTKRFKKVVKDHFKLGTDYGLYSFRHTFVTKLYRELIKESSPNEAKSRLMQITGHTTMAAVEKYLRDIDAELPKDYSEMLKQSK
ncbi:site-specific integrase [Winogradskyella sp. SYSU M77433]|uniref:tyrosine-type recombinase/integrase n=1 Tax=Winogradskyella sp. SYSU M77433 TaxID=3042722 RepID=UPI0024804D9F|nr:site-specific integrase [Winogradskyella sp. SYSU M77433]MDH7914269.1 site-specific integrase [Winogradskyella sp. SYSU M77433]|tara:strand:+ start:2338 stop:3657 length:1320 start_codon:yes stop_codon:yes gene_type:complete